MTQAILIKKYNKDAPLLFKKEKKYILNILKEYHRAINVLHFGSTAVPDLGGKNIIDIFLIVDKKKFIKNILKKLNDNSEYIKWGSGGDKERVFLIKKIKKGKAPVTFHLHVTWKSAKGFRDAIKFRDYLLTHPKEMQNYFVLKKYWAKKAKDKPREYLKMKEKYIKNILKRYYSLYFISLFNIY